MTNAKYLRIRKIHPKGTRKTKKDKTLMIEEPLVKLLSNVILNAFIQDTGDIHPPSISISQRITMYTL